MEPCRSTFAELVSDYIEEKRATGCVFTKTTQTLDRIVGLQNQTDGGEPCLSPELLSRWVEKTPWENETNRNN